MKRARSILNATVNGWIDDDAPSMGAALAFYTLFSMAPLLVIVIAVAGFVVGPEAAQGLLFAQLKTMIGPNGAQAIQAVIAASRDVERGSIATVVSVIALVIGCTTVFAELRSALDRIWKCEAPKGSGAWNFVRTRLLSFGMVMALGFLLLVSLVVSAGLSAVGEVWTSRWKDVSLPLQVLNFLGSFVIVTTLFAMIYKILPSTPIAWREVWIGALATAVLFELGKSLIGLYLGKSALASSFGAAGTLVVVIIWIYYSAQVFFLGAEFTRAYAMRERVDPAVPNPDPPKPAVQT